MLSPNHYFFFLYIITPALIIPFSSPLQRSLSVFFICQLDALICPPFGSVSILPAIAFYSLQRSLLGTKKQSPIVTIAKHHRHDQSIYSSISPACFFFLKKKITLSTSLSLSTNKNYHAAPSTTDRTHHPTPTRTPHRALGRPPSGLHLPRPRHRVHQRFDPTLPPLSPTPPRGGPPAWQGLHPIYTRPRHHGPCPVHDLALGPDATARPSIQCPHRVPHPSQCVASGPGTVLPSGRGASGAGGA